jgi:hypothetical protein
VGSKNNTPRSFVEVDLDIIESLKAKGFDNIQFHLQLTNDRAQATVELIPTKGQDFELTSVALNSSEILDYLEGGSGMARYVIDGDWILRMGEVGLRSEV